MTEDRSAAVRAAVEATYKPEGLRSRPVDSQRRPDSPTEAVLWCALFQDRP